MTTFRLTCRACATARPAGSLDYRCGACGGELVVDYVPGTSRPPLEGAGMWRYADRLPLTDPTHIVSLGEGDTPLVPLERLGRRTGGANVYAKCEHMNPTGSFKDRIASVALSIARERRLAGVVGTSSGNGGAAAAAYASRAGLATVLFALSDIAEQKLAQIRAFGAHVFLVEGIGHDAQATERAAGAIASLAAARGFMPLLTGGRYSPEAMEGATTIARELADEAPETTVVYVPVGGGGLCAALWRGYSHLDAPPRIVAVQPSGCPTLRKALDGDLSGLDQRCTTRVSGLQVAVLFDGHGAVEAVRESGGHLVEVDDSEIDSAQADLATEGLLVEPAGATALAGALADAAAGRLGPDDRVVLITTGAGWKDSAALSRLGGVQAPPCIRPDEIAPALEKIHGD